MFKFNNHSLFEFLGLILVLSYTVLNNIFLVLIGLAISIYMIYLDSNHIFNLRFSLKKIYALITNLSLISKSKEVQEENENSFELLDIVEEHGYIPSIKSKTDKLI
tara:strand:+ start:27 stop:344 length:318 start_codon:yes stop_codon:yes gene_type:complete